MAYQLKLEKFEGPLSLLLELIEKRKLSINEISLADVADQYINYLKTIENFPLEEMGAFISIASTLILIKSSSLMPTLVLSKEETGDIKNLEQRLQLYSHVKNFALILEKQFGRNISFAREPFHGISFDFLEPRNINMEKLFLTIKLLIDNLPKKEILPQVFVKKTMSLENKIAELIARIRQQAEVSFKDAQGNPNRTEIIISFLAILELIKRGFVMVEQNLLFDNIKIRKNI